MSDFVLTVLGGSSAFTPVIAQSLVEQYGSGRLDVRLWGRHPGRLDSVAGLCDRYARHHGVHHRYVGTTDLATACTGANAVVNQIRFGGWPGRTRDEHVSVPFGYPGDETIGPGGLASAVRSTRSTLAVIGHAGAIAPDAWLLNMANPMGVLIAALNQQGAMRTFGLCELPAVTLRRALAILDLREDQVDADYAGINHQGFFTSVRQGRKECLPEILAAIRDRQLDSEFRVDVEVLEALGAIPLPYYRLYAHRDREAAALANRAASRGEELAQLSDRLIASYSTTEGVTLPDELTARSTPWIDEALVPAIVALAGGRQASLFVSAPNQDCLGFLPPNAIVEQRCIVTSRGPRWPTSTNPRTTPVIERFLRRVAEFESLACVASTNPTTTNITRALRAHGFELPPAVVADLTPHILAEAESVS